MIDDALTEAIRLIKSGKRPEAQLILEPFIQENPQNIPAWMWEAEIFLDDLDKIKVMEICLEHNPDHPQVMKALEILRTRAGLPLVPPPMPAPVVSRYAQPRQITPNYVPAPHVEAPKVVASAVEVPAVQRQTPKTVIPRKHPDWPTIEGAVSFSEVREMRSRYTTYYFAEIGAMYVVNNKDYTFKHPYARKANITPYNAQLLTSLYRPGTGVIVSYDPRNPGRAWVDEWDNSVTKQTLNKIKDQPAVRNELSQRYKSRMGTGCGLLAVGILLTVIGTMYLSSRASGAYIAFTGLIAIGLIQFVSGLFGWLWHMD